MSTSEMVTQACIADSFGIDRSVFGKARPFLAGFPAWRNVGKRRRYDLAEVMAWAEGKDINALIKDAMRQERAGDQAAKVSIEQRLQLSKRLFAGEFAPAEQKAKIELKRLAARTLKPKTIRVQLVHDWMDESEHQPQKANYRR